MTPFQLQVAFWFITVVLALALAVPANVIAILWEGIIDYKWYRFVGAGRAFNYWFSFPVVSLGLVVLVGPLDALVLVSLNRYGLASPASLLAVVGVSILLTFALLFLVLLKRGGSPSWRHLRPIVVSSLAVCSLAALLINWPISSWQYRQAAYERLVVKQLYHGTVVGTQVVQVPTEVNKCTAGYACNPHQCDCDDGCKTCWDTCPYTQFEEQYSWVVFWGYKSDGSPRLEPFNFWGTRLPEYTEEYRWRATTPNFDPSGRNGEYRQPIAQAVKERVGTGAPAEWQEAKELLSKGSYPPFTAEKAFENPLMAADSSLWATQSQSVEIFRNRGALPDIKRLPALGRVNLVYTAGSGLNLRELDDFAARLEEFNAAFGAERQGDLRIVFVNDPQASAQPASYIEALKAYWSNPAFHGDYILPKNNLTLVFFTGTLSSTGVARAFTAMPFGNESLLAAINERHVLDNLPTIPDTLLGQVKPEAIVDGEQIRGARYAWQGGALGRLLWGKEDADLAFVRYSMSENFPDFWNWVKPTPDGLILPGMWTVACTAFLTAWLTLPLSDWLSEKLRVRLGT